MDNLQQLTQLILEAEENREPIQPTDDIREILERTHAGLMLALGMVLPVIQSLPADDRAVQGIRSIAQATCQLAEANDVLRAEVA